MTTFTPGIILKLPLVIIQKKKKIQRSEVLGGCYMTDLSKFAAWGETPIMLITGMKWKFSQGIF